MKKQKNGLVVKWDEGYVSGGDVIFPARLGNKKVPSFVGELKIPFGPISAPQMAKKYFGLDVEEAEDARHNR